MEKKKRRRKRGRKKKRVICAEGRKNLSLCKIGEKNPFFGKTHTEETKKILSEKNNLLTKEQKAEIKFKKNVLGFTNYMLITQYNVSEDTIARALKSED